MGGSLVACGQGLSEFWAPVAVCERVVGGDGEDSLLKIQGQIWGSWDQCGAGAGSTGMGALCAQKSFVLFF